MKKGEATEWTVGDICTCVYDERGYGILYRVTKVEVYPHSNQPYLSLIPIYGLLQDVSKRRARPRISAGYCAKMTLVDLASEYMKLGNFIAGEAAKNTEESDGSTSDTPAS